MRFFSTLAMRVRGHLQVRNKKNSARMGNNNDAQSKMRTARARFIRRPVTFFPSGVLLQSRTIDSSLMKR
jgi:hypothetical protein